jgi:hypothetical protein
LQAYPNEDTLKKNAIFTYDRWANGAMTKKDWPEAIRIYEEALGHFPGESALQNNMKYCKARVP